MASRSDVATGGTAGGAIGGALSFAALVASLFSAPGAHARDGGHILARAAAVHARLLMLAALHDSTVRRLVGTPFCEILYRCALFGRHSANGCQGGLLESPQLIEALHTLAAGCPALVDWDRKPSNPERADAALRLGGAKLGNVAMPLLLAADPTWCGCAHIATNAYGRITFPKSPCSIALYETNGDAINGGRDLFVNTVVRLVADRQAVRLYVDCENGVRVSCDGCLPRCDCESRMPHHDDKPFLVCTRRDWFRLLGVAARPDTAAEHFHPRIEHPTIQPEISHSFALPHSSVALEAVSAGSDAHSSTTRAIAEALFAALENCCPAIFAEFCAYIHTLRTFSLPPASLGLVQSFSAPDEPGVVGLNVAYSAEGDPLLSPLCFTWLGHELGHTKHYLIDDVVFGRHLRFLDNPGETTPVLPCYGRSLRVGTLFQIPYVHLYERALLMNFVEHDFSGLPWDVDVDWRAAGDEIGDEISGAFDLIGEHAELTPLGSAAVGHFKNLAALDAVRWRWVRAARQACG